MLLTANKEEEMKHNHDNGAQATGRFSSCKCTTYFVISISEFDYC